MFLEERVWLRLAPIAPLQKQLPAELAGCSYMTGYAFIQFLLRRDTPSIYNPYVTEFISWTLDVYGRESVVGAGADSTTLKTITSRASRLLWFLRPSVYMTGYAFIQFLLRYRIMVKN